MIRKIGRGKYSEVFEGINVRTNKMCVIKVITRDAHAHLTQSATGKEGESAMRAAPAAVPCRLCCGGAVRFSAAAGFQRHLAALTAAPL